MACKFYIANKSKIDDKEKKIKSRSFVKNLFIHNGFACFGFYFIYFFRHPIEKYWMIYVNIFSFSVIFADTTRRDLFVFAKKIVDEFLDGSSIFGFHDILYGNNEVIKTTFFNKYISEISFLLSLMSLFSLVILNLAAVIFANFLVNLWTY